MNTSRLVRPITRRHFLRSLALGLGAGLLTSTGAKNAAAEGVPAATSWLFSGANYPWIHYGADFGENAWGHSGLSDPGWVPQTNSDSQGLTATRVVREHAHTGLGALAITANLLGNDPNRSKGEVFVDLSNHAPPGVTAPLDLTGKTARCWLYLPPGCAGSALGRNGVQIFYKSLPGWKSYYSRWTNIDPAWEGTYHEFVDDLSNLADYPDFNPASVIAVGIKVGTSDRSYDPLQCTFYLDDFQLDTNLPIRFDFEETELERDLASISCTTAVLRVFVFADGRASPEFTEAGAVASPGLDDHFFPDFDTLVQSASRFNFKLIPVLLDFTWCYLAQMVSGVQIGGHAAIIRDTTLRQTFLDNALRPLIQRYAQSPQILAWEIMNEPEWVIQELNPNNAGPDYVSLAQMQAFVKACTDLIHSVNPALTVTVGSARRKWVSQWKDMGLDLYQFHWYDNMAVEEPFPWLPYQDLGLDKPCFIGEVPTAQTSHSVADYLSAARSGGYSGLLVWAYRSQDGYDNFSAVNTSLGQYCTILPGVMK